MYANKFRVAQRGISTVAAMFMLLLMFTTLIVLVVAFFDYDLTAKEQMKIDHERSQEKIMLTRIEINNESKTISTVVINNIGSIEVRIRALYEITNGETSFLFDPSTYSETQIAPTESLVISIPQDFPKIPFDAQSKIVASTERGTKTLDSVPKLVYGPVELPTNYDPTKLYVGPLMLKFDDFFYQKTNSTGDIDPTEWKPGWYIDEKLPFESAWKITVMNIENRTLTLRKFSSFNLVLTDSPNVRSWYIESTDQNREQTLAFNQTETIIFIWDNPFNYNPQTVSSTFKDSTSMVFLTFFGVFHEDDGTYTPYAQTIPFEASVTIP